MSRTSIAMAHPTLARAPAIVRTAVTVVGAADVLEAAGVIEAAAGAGVTEVAVEADAIVEVAAARAGEGTKLLPGIYTE